MSNKEMYARASNDTIMCHTSNSLSAEDKNENDELEQTESSMPSSLDANSLEIGEITEVTDPALMSTSAVLFYCKSKILSPYLKLLSLMGLRPVSMDQLHNSKLTKLVSHYHTFQITVLIILGYILQYMSCFRRDRGLYNKPIPTTFTNDSSLYEQACYGSSVFSYIIPYTLHFTAYVYAIYLFRISDNEQLQNLMERVFLLSSYPPQGTTYTSPKNLLRTLWFYLFLSLIWTVFSFILVCLMIIKRDITFQWIDMSCDQVKLAAKVLLIICSLTHDMVQATIITNYCLQAQLLTAHLNFLRNRLLTRSISPLDWMREIAEFKKLLRHLNEVLAPGISLFTISNICWACSGMVWLLSLDKTDLYPVPIAGLDILNELLWILAAAIPFISAARLTMACSLARGVGHEIIVRPFLHQDTPQEDLNSVMLYASFLQLSARLFRLPITGRYLCLTLTIISILILTFGMSHYILL